MRLEQLLQRLVALLVVLLGPSVVDALIAQHEPGEPGHVDGIGLGIDDLQNVQAFQVDLLVDAIEVVDGQAE